MASDAWLTLLLAAQFHSRPWLTALKALGSAEAVVAQPAAALEARGFAADAVAKIKAPDPDAIARCRAWLAAPRRTLVTFGSADYPPLLAANDDAPLGLWVEGASPALLAAPQLAMVGSRNPTAGGRETAEQFARYLAQRGLTITSGLATGIDGASHRGAVAEVGGTIAVQGCGLDRVFPRDHEQLASQIAERGLVVSEYSPGVGPEKFHFPRRNRIIAALSLGTLVVEATRRSGSLITAKLAAEYGREVFAIPGSIHNPLARGCHALIRQGAKLVEEAADVFLELGPQLALAAAEAPTAAAAAPPPASQPLYEADPSYRKLLAALGFSPVAIGDLAARVHLTTAELSSMLLVLELEGLVEALPGGRYSRLGKEN